MKYAPSLRGFVLGVALWAAIAAQGCFPKFDDARMRINPETGETIVERVGKSIPKPGDDAFVGPPAPSPAESFSEGKATAKADFNKTVGWASGVAIWGLLALAAITFLASLVVNWIPTGASLKCALAAAGVVGLRYALISFGTIAVDLAVYISAATAIIVGAVVGLPLVISWVKRKAWNRGVELATKGEHVEASVALLATVDPAIDKARKQVDEWLEIFHKGDRASSVWTEAKMQLVRLGVIKPEAK